MIDLHRATLQQAIRAQVAGFQLGKPGDAGPTGRGGRRRREGQNQVFEIWPASRSRAGRNSVWVETRIVFGGDDDWVFASPQKAGQLPLRPASMLEKQIKPAAQAAGLGSGVGWHTFRHTYSTMLRQLGVDVKVQQELLRHADIRTTMNGYTQAISEQKRAAHSKVVRMVLT